MLKHEETTEAVIKAFYDVYNALGYGFLEKVYESALAIELRSVFASALQQVPVHVYYRGAVVGEYFADVLVDGK